MKTLFSLVSLNVYFQERAQGGGRWWHTPLEGRGRQISEFEASLVYRVSSRTAKATQRNPVSKKKKNPPV